MLEIDYTSQFERDETGSSACKSGNNVSRNLHSARARLMLTALRSTLCRGLSVQIVYRNQSRDIRRNAFET